MYDCNDDDDYYLRCLNYLLGYLGSKRFFLNNNRYSHSELRDSSYVIRSLTTLDSPCMSSLV